MLRVCRSLSELMEIAYDLIQVIVIIIHGAIVIGIDFNAEARSAELVKGLVAVPWAAPDETFSAKVKAFCLVVSDMM